MEIDKLFASFGTKKVLVVGDVMIDAYIKGSVTRISPEAPVPIVNLAVKEDRLGGAANVALNLIALGAEVFVASVIGADEAGTKMEQLFTENGIHCESLFKSKERITTVKTRILGNNQQLVRIDSEQTTAINLAEEVELITQIKKLIDKEQIDAIIFEDYNKGVLTPKVIEEIVDYATDKNIITTVDPKKDNFFAYKKVTLFKPNLKELKEGLDRSFDIKDKVAFEAAIAELEVKLNHEISFVTLSEHGVFIKDRENKQYIPAHVRNIADVSGAGDTVISVATLCLAVKLPIHQVAQIANISGGLVCEEVGVVSINKDKLKEEVRRIIGDEVK